MSPGGARTGTALSIRHAATAPKPRRLPRMLAVAGMAFAIDGAAQTPTRASDPLADQPDFLPVDAAFVLSARREAERLVFRWEMPDGYYLYRHAFGVQAPPALDGATSGSETDSSEIAIPAGLRKVDEFFGETEVYYDTVEIAAPVRPEWRPQQRERQTPQETPTTVLVTYQGCADYGLCYPPQQRIVAFGSRGESASIAKPPRR